MKQIIPALLLFSIAIISCNSHKDKPKEQTTTVETKTVETKAEESKPVADSLFSCSMHPEVRGKKSDKCSKCGMFLTAPLK